MVNEPKVTQPVGSRAGQLLAPHQLPLLSQTVAWPGGGGAGARGQGLLSLVPLPKSSQLFFSHHSLILLSIHSFLHEHPRLYTVPWGDHIEQAR